MLLEPKIQRTPKAQAGDLLAPGDPIIRLVNVHKAFGKQVVLDGISLDIPAGRTTVVLGPSGCGKSVMLKHIVGLLRPDKGEVHFAGRRVDLLDEDSLVDVRLQIGLLFQMGALFDSMSVADNIAFPLVEHTDLSADERRAKVEDALRRVDLAGFGPKLPAQLSGGQRKRAALARAIVIEPRVVLFDEPTTGLDPIRSDGIDRLVRKLQAEMGVTNLVVTHDLTSARKIADYVVMLLDGKIAAQGTFDELTASPNPRVQHFLAGRYERSDDADVSSPAESR